MKVSADKSIAAPIDRVWDTVKRFGGVARWAPGVTDCQADGDHVGAIRTIKTKDGLTIVERLETYDEDARTFSYTIVESPLPVTNYVGSVSVSDAGGMTTVRWTTSADSAGIPDEQLEKILGGVCHGSVKALKAHCEMQGTTQTARLRPEDL